MSVLVHAFHRGVRSMALALGGQFGRLEGTAGPPPDEQEVSVPGGALRVLRWRGHGVPLLLLHGLHHNAWVWARLVNLLRGERDVVALTQRGHGPGCAPPAGYSLAQTTADVRAVMDALGLGRVDLAGHSWGGKVATHVALTLPERVRSLVLADPVGPRGLNGVIRAFPGLVQAALAPERGPFASPEARDRGAQQLVYLSAGNQVDYRFWRACFQQDAEGRFTHHLPAPALAEILAGALAEDLSPRLGALRAPVLLLRPTFTLNFLPGELAVWRRAGAPVQVRAVTGDHGFIHSNPRDTALALRGFLPPA